MVRTLVEQVHKELRDRILAGTWHLGERLYEEAIAKELAVSRAPVREAIRMLEQEGLIVRRPHRGLFVASPSPLEILQTAYYRALLEVYAVRWGRPHEPRDIDQLIMAANSMDDAAGRGDVLEVVNLDIRFHGALAGVCDNRVLLRHYHELDGHMALFLHAIVDPGGRRIAAMGERHRAIVRTIVAGPDALGEAIIVHYRTAGSALMERSDGPDLADRSRNWRLA